MDVKLIVHEAAKVVYALSCQTPAVEFDEGESDDVIYKIKHAYKDGGTLSTVTVGYNPAILKASLNVISDALIIPAVKALLKLSGNRKILTKEIALPNARSCLGVYNTAVVRAVLSEVKCPESWNGYKEYTDKFYDIETDQLISTDIIPTISLSIVTDEKLESNRSKVRYIKIQSCLDCPYRDHREAFGPIAYAPYCAKANRELPYKIKNNGQLQRPCAFSDFSIPDWCPLEKWGLISKGEHVEGIGMRSESEGRGLSS